MTVHADLRPKRVCAIDGCGRCVFARGWCSTHYQRWWRHGDPLTVIDRRRPLVHGTVDGYQNHGCRCDECRAASHANYVAKDIREQQNRWRWRTGRNRPRDVYLAEIEAEHGTESRYKRCRCDACRAAAAAERRRRRALMSEAEREVVRARDRARKRRARQVAA